MANSNSIVVGSSSESSIGVGTLLKFNSEDVISVHHNEDGWVIEVRLEDGGVCSYSCYDVLWLQSDLLGSTIEECDIEEFR